MQAETDPSIEKAIKISRSQKELSRLSGLSQQHISKLLLKQRRPSGEVAIAIENATGGAVSRSEIRPDLWQDYKPETKNVRIELDPHAA